MTEPRPCNPELLPVLDTIDVAPPGFFIILRKAGTFLISGMGLCISLGCSQTHSFKPSREKEKTPAMSLAAVATRPPICFHLRNTIAPEAEGDVLHLQTAARVADPVERLSSLWCSVKQCEGSTWCQICLQALTEEDRTWHIQVIKTITNPQ